MSKNTGGGHRIGAVRGKPPEPIRLNAPKPPPVPASLVGEDRALRRGLERIANEAETSLAGEAGEPRETLRWIVGEVRAALVASEPPTRGVTFTGVGGGAGSVEPVDSGLRERIEALRIAAGDLNTQERAWNRALDAVLMRLATGSEATPTPEDVT